MYLVIGANGYLGRYCLQSIERLTSDNIIATSRNINGMLNTKRVTWRQVDITSEMSFDLLIKQVEKQKKVKVIFLAAYHNPDMVQKNPEYAWNINVTCLSRCINCLSFANRLFYASSDCVYGDSKNGYHFKENDELNPVNDYGLNKCAAEALIKWHGFNVIRLPFLIAHSLVPNKMHFYDRIVNNIKQGKIVKMFKDSYRSSLNFKTAADIMIELIEKKEKVPSILNVCGDNALSKYDIGLMIANKMDNNGGGLSKLIQPISIKDNVNIYEANRASSTLMDNTKVKEVLGIKKIDFVI